MPSYMLDEGTNVKKEEKKQLFFFAISIFFVTLHHIN